MTLKYMNIRSKIWSKLNSNVWDSINETPTYRASLARQAKYDIADAVEFTCKDRIWMGVYETTL